VLCAGTSDVRPLSLSDSVASVWSPLLLIIVIGRLLAGLLRKLTDARGEGFKVRMHAL